MTAKQRDSTLDDGTSSTCSVVAPSSRLTSRTGRIASAAYQRASRVRSFVCRISGCSVYLMIQLCDQGVFIIQVHIAWPAGVIPAGGDGGNIHEPTASAARPTRPKKSVW